MERQNATRDRIIELDAMRTLAFVGVVLQHVLGAYARRSGVSLPENIVIAVLFGLCKFAVPAFLFVSGVVLFYNYYGKLHYLQFLKKRLSSIVFPYLIWSVFYFLFEWHTQGEMPGKRAFLMDIVTGDVSYHTWYVILIIQFYVFLPVIFALFSGLTRKIRTKMGWVCLLCAVCAGYVALLYIAPALEGVPILGEIFYTWRTKNFLFYLVYFLMGGLCALHLDAFRAFVRRAAPFLAVAALLLYAYVEWRFFQEGFAYRILNLNLMGSLNTRCFLFTVISIFMIYLLSIRISQNRKAQKVSAWIGKHSYTAYLAHAMVITQVSLTLVEHAPGISYPAFYSILTAVVLAVTLLTAWLYDWIYGSIKRRIVVQYNRTKKIHSPS